MNVSRWSAPLDGVPQMPDDIIEEAAKMHGVSEEMEARGAEAIAAACAEIQRRRSRQETAVPVHVHEFGERPALRRKRSSEA